MTVFIGDQPVGGGYPCVIVGEIGINHQHDRWTLSRLIDVAREAGCDFVKFQTRTPELQVPRDKWHALRDTPWGEMRTIDYRRRIELDDDDYRFIAAKSQSWFSSPWDVPSVGRLERYDPPAYKVASAVLPNADLLRAIRATGKPIVMSTGMSTLDDVQRAVDVIGDHDLVLLACTSDYPCADVDINLAVIETLRDAFPGVPIGYSGHEVGVLPSVLAVAAYGACMVERHITLDRGLPGSDHGASLEPRGLGLLVRDIRRAEALRVSDGVKRITDGERKQIERLRECANLNQS